MQYIFYTNINLCTKYDIYTKYLFDTMGYE